jgi:hypothetical protein
LDLEGTRVPEEELYLIFPYTLVNPSPTYSLRERLGSPIKKDDPVTCTHSQGGREQKSTFTLWHALQCDTHFIRKEDREV